MKEFDHVYVIHLPVRETRVQGELVHAKPPHSGFTMNNMRRNPPAEFGVGLSHLKAIVRAIDSKAQRPLFLEDDIEFTGTLPELPIEYDVLYLGGHPRSPTKPHSPGIVRIGTFCFAEAYSISRKALVPFFEFWCDRIGQPNAMYDIILGEFAAKTNSYACYPCVTRQVTGFSFVGMKVDEKQHLVEKGWRNNLSIKSQ